MSKPRIALLLPCLNEAQTLAQVIQDFRQEIAELEVYVFDNQSTDNSRAIALENQATVIHVPKRGKGHVVRKMFEVVEADIYIMVDADGTYDAKGVHQLLEPVLSGHADMAVGSRLSEASPHAFRAFHRFGNRLIQKLINTLFQSSLEDICSGYRVMSHHFVKNIPLLRDGFEVETELTVYSLICGFHIVEKPLKYGSRPEGSFSKLHTFRDGYKVLLTIIWLARDLRPLLFFGFLSGVLFTLAIGPLSTFFPHHLLLKQGVMLLSISCFFTGILLNTLSVKFAELHSMIRRQAKTSSLSRDLSKTKPASPSLPRSLSWQAPRSLES